MHSGSLLLVSKPKPLPECVNIDCKNGLTSFEMKRLPKEGTNKYMFCMRCRQKISNGKVVRWKCKGCNNILSSVYKQTSSLFCNDKCRYDYHLCPRKKNPKTQKCLDCSKEFLTYWANYCSQKCRLRAIGKKRRRK